MGVSWLSIPGKESAVVVGAHLSILTIPGQSLANTYRIAPGLNARVQAKARRKTERYSVLAIGGGKNVFDLHEDVCIRYWRHEDAKITAGWRIMDQLVMASAVTATTTNQQQMKTQCFGCAYTSLRGHRCI
jgi:hypothetical protein